MDIAAALVAIGLVGEYWKPLRKVGKSLRLLNWRVASLRLLKITFPLLVVVGVAAEFAISLRVSLIENEWEISQLPRDLSEAQQRKIATKLKPFSGMHFDLEMHQDIEPMRLLDKIENALLLAGWEEQPPRSDHQTFDRVNRSKVAIGRTVAGVWVLWPQPSSEPFKSAADALVKALRDNGITATLVTATHPDAYDSDKIHIWVGARP